MAVSLLSRMTPQQRSVMDAAVKHYSVAESAKTLCITETTVYAHRHRAANACGMNSNELLKALFSEYMKEAESESEAPSIVQSHHCALRGYA